MAKSRTTIPKSVQDAVLSEYNHKCAVCGKDRPQLHHIDENPSNHDKLNLLPLCPNHHLSDQHNPTTKIDSLRLQLFRQFKDPLILSPQFEPIFRRSQFLFNEPHNLTYQNLMVLSQDLLRFVQHLEMGGYYHNAIFELITSAGRHLLNLSDDLSFPEDETNDETIKVKIRLQRSIELIVELLRYQNWSYDPA